MMRNKWIWAGAVLVTYALLGAGALALRWWQSNGPLVTYSVSKPTSYLANSRRMCVLDLSVVNDGQFPAEALQVILNVPPQQVLNIRPEPAVQWSQNVIRIPTLKVGESLKARILLDAALPLPEMIDADVRGTNLTARRAAK